MKLHFFVFALFFFAEVQAQKIKYNLSSFPYPEVSSWFNGKIETVHKNGSVLYSRKQGNSIVVDSIDADGLISRVYEKTFPDSYSISGYDFDENLNLYIVNRVSKKSALGGPTDFLLKDLEYYPIDSMRMAWRVHPRNNSNYSYTENNYRPYLSGSLVYLVGGTMSDGDCYPDLDYFVYARTGDSIAHVRGEFLNSCQGLFYEIESNRFISGRRCTCSSEFSISGLLNKFSTVASTNTVQEGKVFENNVHIRNLARIVPLQGDMSWGVSTNLYSSTRQDAYVVVSDSNFLNINRLFNFSENHLVLNVENYKGLLHVLSSINKYDALQGESYELVLSVYNFDSGAKFSETISQGFGKIDNGYIPTSYNHRIADGHYNDRNFYITYRSRLNGLVTDFFMRYTIPAFILGVEFNRENIKFSIYPNPANTNLNINFEQAQETTVSLYSLTGSLMLQKQVNTQNAQLDVSGLPKGMYVVKVETEHGVESKKIAISR